ncbi:hypothetical protein Tco_0609938 [Tanacetum coccineum]
MADTRLWLNAPSTHRGYETHPFPEIVATQYFGAEAWVNQSCPKQTVLLSYKEDLACTIRYFQQDHLHNEGPQCSNFYRLSYAFPFSIEGAARKWQKKNPHYPFKLGTILMMSEAIALDKKKPSTAPAPISCTFKAFL